MGRCAGNQDAARCVAALPKSHKNYQQHGGDMSHTLMHSILLFSEVPHMQLENICHDRIEHVETGSLLHLTTSMIDHIKDRSQYLIHALHILYSWIQSSKDKENPCHVVVPVSDLLLLRRGRSPGTTIAADEFVFLAASGGEKGNGESFGRPREEGKLRLSSASILLDLLPQTMVLLKGCQKVLRRVTVQKDRPVLVLTRVQKLPHELSVQLLMLLCL